MPAVLLRSATLDGAVTHVLVDDGVIAAIGPDLAPPADAQVVDLDGRVLLPGLWDAHVHFDQWTLARRRLDLGPAGSAADAVALVAARLRTDPAEPGTVLVGHGFRDALWPDAPHRDLLDPVTGAVPVVLVAADLHCCWVNSAAAARYGMAQHPTGLIRERDWLPIMTDIRGGATSVLPDRLAAETGRAAAARGVVGVVDYEAPWQLDAWASRVTAGADALRVVASVWPEALDGPDGPIARGLRSGDVVPGTGGLLTMGPLKVVTDGSLNTRTAYCHDPFPGAGVGMLLVPPEVLVPLLHRAATHGLDAAVHAIGDRANREALDAFASTRELWQPLGLRHRIEHAQCLDPADVGRFAELGVACSVQYSHAPSDRDLAERFWDGRLDGTYAFRSLTESGAVVANGSDAPVEELDPLAGVAAGVRRTIDDRPAWRPDESVTVEQALHATTVAPAWLAGDERRRGTLLPGRLADLVVLDRAPVACEPDELPSVEVVATMVGGRWVHNPPPWG